MIFNRFNRFNNLSSKKDTKSKLRVGSLVYYINQPYRVYQINNDSSVVLKVLNSNAKITVPINDIYIMK